MDEQANGLQNNPIETNSTQEIPEGYFPARVIAAKYGYSKDYLTRLLRNGHIKGFQRNNALRDWFVEEASIRAHRQRVLQDQFAKPAIARRDVEVPPVLYTAPSNNKGSLNAEPKPQRPVGLSATLRFSLLGGILLFITLINFGILTLNTEVALNKFENAKSNIFTPVKESIKTSSLLVLDKITSLFSSPDFPVAEKVIVIRQIYEQGTDNIRVVTWEGKETIREIVRETQSIPSDALASITSQIKDLKSEIQNTKYEIQNTFQRVPTIVQLPSSNTSGIGSITSNPQKVATETLTVSSSATLSQLDVTTSTHLFGNLTVDGTTNLVKAETQGTSSASYGMFGTLQVAGFSSTSYSRFGTDTTTHTGTISGSNDFLFSRGF